MTRHEVRGAFGRHLRPHPAHRHSTASAGGVEQFPPQLEWEREEAMVLALLREQSGPVTMSTLHERGIPAPAQAIYELTLAGYEIERVPIRDGEQLAHYGYRLRGLDERFSTAETQPRQDAPDLAQSTG